MSKAILNKYYTKIKLILIITIITIVIIFLYTLGKAIDVFQTFKILNAIRLENQQVKDFIEFRSGKVEFIFPRQDRFYVFDGFLEENVHGERELKKGDDFQTKGFSGTLYDVSDRDNISKYDQKLKASSRFLNINEKWIELAEDVRMDYKTIKKSDFNDLILEIERVKFFLNQDILGINVLAKNKIWLLRSGKIFFNNSMQKVFASGGVVVQNQEYSLSSKKMELHLDSGDIARADISDSVIFVQQDAENTRVTGEGATYLKSSNTILIYDNVKITSSRNNLVIGAETFEYNTLSKKGKFVGKKSEQVNVELEI